jgi:hypothetical protein
MNRIVEKCVFATIQTRRDAADLEKMKKHDEIIHMRNLI